MVVPVADARSAAAPAVVPDDPAPVTAVAAPVPQPARGTGGPERVAAALLMLQGSFGLVAVLGELVLMGVLHTVFPLLHVVALWILARHVGRRRRWALVVTVVAQGMALAGWLLQLLIGVLPQLDHTVNPVGLLTTVALPIAVTVLCCRVLIAGAHR